MPVVSTDRSLLVQASRVGTEIGSYELESELAREGLRATDRDPDRRLAWANSICMLFLLIGVTGSKPTSIRIKPLPPVEEVMAAIVEPLPPPRQAESEPQEVQNEQNNPDTPQVVVVSTAAPNISFSVPTIGNLVVPVTASKAPPLAPLKQVAPLRKLPTVLNNTGSGGERPTPPYPRMAEELRQEGTVTLRLTVDDAGLIKEIEVAQSSGFPILDRSALDYVRRHWIVPPGQGVRIYEAPITYKLRPM